VRGENGQLKKKFVRNENPLDRIQRERQKRTEYINEQAKTLNRCLSRRKLVKRENEEVVTEVNDDKQGCKLCSGGNNRDERQSTIKLA